jgi:hypothetical protein
MALYYWQAFVPPVIVLALILPPKAGERYAWVAKHWAVRWTDWRAECRADRRL